MRASCLVAVFCFFSVVVLPSKVYGQFGANMPVKIAAIEADGETCKVTAFIVGNSTPWILYPKKRKDCRLLSPGSYIADLSSITSEENGTRAHFHDGWRCSQNDCYDNGTYLTPAQHGAIKTIFTFNVKTDKKYVPLLKIEIISNTPVPQV